MKKILTILVCLGLYGCVTTEGVTQERKSLPVFRCFDIGYQTINVPGLYVEAEFVEGRDYPVIYFSFNTNNTKRDSKIKTLDFNILGSKSNYVYGPNNSFSWDTSDVSKQPFVRQVYSHTSYKLTFLDINNSFIKFLTDIKNSEDEIERASFNPFIGESLGQGGYNVKEFTYQAFDIFNTPILGLTKGQPVFGKRETQNLGSMCYYYENIDTTYEEYVDGLKILNKKSS